LLKNIGKSNKFKLKKNTNPSFPYPEIRQHRRIVRGCGTQHKIVHEK